MNYRESIFPLQACVGHYTPRSLHSERGSYACPVPDDIVGRGLSASCFIELSHSIFPGNILCRGHRSGEVCRHKPRKFCAIVYLSHGREGRGGYSSLYGYGYRIDADFPKEERVEVLILILLSALCRFFHLILRYYLLSFSVLFSFLSSLLFSFPFL